MSYRTLLCIIAISCFLACAIAFTPQSEQEVRALMEQKILKERSARAARDSNENDDNDGSGTRGSCRKPGALPNNFDYIVIGAGTAGCVIANRLATTRVNNQYAKVLLIEAGGVEDETDLVRTPINWQITPGSAIDWGYMMIGGELISFDLGKRHISAGKALGGTSTINTMMFVRGNQIDYNNWGAQNPGWSYNDVLPFFKSIETSSRYASNPAFHGNSGPLKIGPGAWEPVEDNLLIQGAANWGLPFNPDWNGATQIGSGFHELTIFNGIRQTSYGSFIAPILNRRNLYVQDHSMVHRILFRRENNQPSAYGVVFVDNLDASCHTVYASNEIIISAGAIRSPQLLMVNGIGPADELNDLGIDVVKNLPGVGKNLHDHVISTMTFGSIFPQAPGSVQDQAAYDLWNFNKTGIIGSITARANFFFRSAYAADARPDAQIIVTTPGPTQFALCYLNKPRSRGFLQLHSSDMTDLPQPKFNYFQNPTDLSAMIDIMNKTQQILNTAPLATTFPFFNADFNSVSSMTSYLLGSQFGNGNAGTAQHFVGTCKMGPASDPMAVVDNRLRVRGVGRLRVADASIMPEITTGNTQAPTYMIGAKAASMILADN